MIKTTSLETSKLLKESGFQQNNYFTWMHNKSGVEKDKLMQMKETESYKRYKILNSMGCIEYSSAPTTDELLEVLPYVIDKSRWQLMICKGDNCYGVWYRNSSDNNTHRGYLRCQSLPEALASMWILLKKEGLI